MNELVEYRFRELRVFVMLLASIIAESVAVVDALIGFLAPPSLGYVSFATGAAFLLIAFYGVLEAAAVLQSGWARAFMSMFREYDDLPLNDVKNDLEERGVIGGDEA